MGTGLRVIRTTIGDAAELPIQYFLEHVLPPLHPDVDVDNVLSKLKRSGKKSHRAITKAGRWWGFAQDPEAADRCEQTSYANFPRIVDAIAKNGAPRGIKPRLVMMHNSYQGRPVNERKHDTFSDAYMVLRGTSRIEASWENIGVVGEYEKCLHSVNVNADKLCWSASRAFEHDPCRRFMFGYTIEDRYMKLWYCDRAQTLFSERFNFITDHRIVVHAFLSLLFAQPHQLGWDPSMKRIEGTKGKAQYEFTVEAADGSTTVYRSQGLISSRQDNRITGTGTRVWKVVKIVDGIPDGDPAVLKDSWIQEEYVREGDTIEQLRQSNSSPEFQQIFNARFLTVICHGDVIVHSECEPDHMDRTRCHWENAKAFQLGNPLTDERFSRPGTRPDPPKWAIPPRYPLTGRKVHYRIVFKEICKPLDGNTAVVFRALSQACQALKLLHEAGWVHRDVSMGNILLDESGDVRLADLEHAKRMGDVTIPEVRTGTAPFIASEADVRSHWCDVPSTPPSEAGLLPISRSRKRHPSEARSPSSGSAKDQCHSSSTESFSIFDLPSPPSLRSCSDPPRPSYYFRYNPLHDLESLFWIATYHIFTTDLASEVARSDPDPVNLEARRRTMNHLFHDELQRRNVIVNQRSFMMDLNCLSLPSRAMGCVLDRWRVQLSQTYWAAEKDCPSITASVAAGLHESFIRAMGTMLELAMRGSRKTGHEVDDGPQPHGSRCGSKRTNTDAADTARPTKRART